MRFVSLANADTLPTLTWARSIFSSFPRHVAALYTDSQDWSAPTKIPLFWVALVLLQCVLLSSAIIFAVAARRHSKEAAATKRKLEEEARERGRAETALRRSEEEYRLVFESNPQSMWVYDVDTLRFLAVNNTALRDYGYSRDEFLALTIRQIRPPEEVPTLLENLAKDDAGISHSGQALHLKRDGELIHVEIAWQPILFAGRQARLVLASDVSARRRLEDQLRQLQKNGGSRTAGRRSGA
jgi:PAS domain S-box-containing protein